MAWNDYAVMLSLRFRISNDFERRTFNNVPFEMNAGEAIQPRKQ